MAKKQQRKQEKGVGVGSIVAMVIAGLVLVGILGGVVWYVHSGRAGLGQSAGLLTAGETTIVSDNTSDGEEDAAAADDTEEVESKKADEASEKKTTKADRKDTNTPKDSAKSSSNGSAAVAFKSKTTAKTLGKYYDADTDAFRKAYDGKTVTVSGSISDKSAKMLYVELETGKKVPLRVYLNSEEQREQFSKFAKGDTITVKGTMGVLYPMDTDAGGFQEMANGLIALDTVTLVN